MGKHLPLRNHEPPMTERSERPASAGVLGRLLDAVYGRIPFDLLDRLAARPAWATLAVGVLALLGSALVALIAGFPLPMIHDEFAYLLQADTFALGRLTNPTHPMWQHFETFHVLWQPTYASKYPPAQGLVLALGQILGHPAIGVWISASAMCAAITWMFLAWLPGRWALVGGIVVALQLGTVSYWAQSYWGGAVAATGGALLFGALRRLLDAPRLRDGFALGVGLAVLANSRPFEGFLVSLPAAAVLVWALFRHRTGRLFAALEVALAVLVITGASMLHYNHRVTGDFLTMPQSSYNETYALTPNFFWQERPANSRTEFRHPEFEKFFRDYALERYEEMQDPSGFLLRSLGRLIEVSLFFLGAGLLAMIGLRQTLRDRWILLAGGIILLLLLADLFTNIWPHYLAPITGLIFVVMIACLRAVHGWSTPHFEGRRAVLLIVGFFALSFPLRLAVLAAYERAPESFVRQREALIAELHQRPGRDLVIVRYEPSHSVHQEWVYNEADIDAAEIVWARDMGVKNEELIWYYRSRRIWYLNVNAKARFQEVLRSDNSRITS